MNTLFKLNNNNTCKLVECLTKRFQSALSTTSSVANHKPLLSSSNISIQSPSSIKKEPAAPSITQSRSHYTFNLSKRPIRYRRATRPKKTNDLIQLNYEQAQFAEKIGVTKSWNTWNTCKSAIRPLYS